MSDQTITVTLPDSICERIKATAQAASLTTEEVIRQSVSLLLPAFESDIRHPSFISLHFYRRSD